MGTSLEARVLRLEQRTEDLCTDPRCMHTFGLALERLLNGLPANSLPPHPKAAECGRTLADALAPLSRQPGETPEHYAERMGLEPVSDPLGGEVPPLIHEHTSEMSPAQHA